MHTSCMQCTYRRHDSWICLLNASAGMSGDTFETYSASYYSKRWINAHLLALCNSGLGSEGEIKKCIQVPKIEALTSMDSSTCYSSFLKSHRRMC